MSKERSNRLFDDGRFVVAAVFLLLASFAAWQISFQANRGPDNIPNPGKESIPEGFTWVEQDNFGYLYPDDWPEPMSEAQPIETAVLNTVQHPPILYDASLDVWVIAEKTENFEEGDIYNGLAVARRERNLTVYEAGYADNNCGFSLYVFESGDNLVQFRLPTFCFGSEEAEENDAILFSQAEFDKEQEVLFSITPVTELETGN